MIENKKVKVPEGGERIERDTPKILVEEPTLEHEIYVNEELIESILDELNLEIRENLGHLAGKGAILYGFPGTGKNVLVKKIAQDLGAKIIRIEKDMPVTQIRESFDYARKQAKNERTFVVIDEIDDFGTKEVARYTGGLSKIVALMTEMDGLKDNSEVKDNLYIFAMTNYLENVDQRLLRPGRLEEIIELPLPDRKTRQKIILSILKGTNGLKVSEEIKKYSEIIAQKTNGFTPADLRGLLKKIGICAIKNGLDNEKVIKIIKDFEPTAKRGYAYFKEPELTFDDIIGREVYKNFFEESLKDGTNGGGNFLLYGPRGTGKTIFPEALAGQFEYNFLKVKGSELQEGIVGEGTKSIKRLFNLAKTAKPSIILLDEIDGMITKRGTISHKDDETAYLNSELSTPIKGVYVMATINNPLLLNETTLSRFQHKVYFEPCEEEERKAYFKAKLNGKINGYASYLAKITAGYSFRDLKFVTDAVNRYSEKVNVDYEKLLDKVINSYKREGLNDYENFEEIKALIGDSLEIEKFIKRLK